MNSLALLDKVLLLATKTTTAKWGKQVTSEDKYLATKLPKGCVGYAYECPKDAGMLNKILDLCRNNKGQKMLCSYVVKSNDLRWPSRIVIYMTETMAQKWSEDTPLPSALTALISTLIKDEESQAEIPADDDESEAPANN